MTLGPRRKNTANSAECARCGALPFFSSSSSRSSLSPRFPKDGPHDAGPKNSADIAVVALLNETFFPFQKNVRHSLKFFFYASFNRITLITLAIFFHSPISQKKNDKVIRFIHVEWQSRKWPHTTGFFIGSFIVCYLAGVIRPFVTSSNALEFRTEFYCYLFGR